MLRICFVFAIAGFFSAAGFAIDISDYFRPSELDASLQTAIRQFTPKDKSKPKIVLVAVGHIGEDDYYPAILKHVNQVNLVLHENIGNELFEELEALDPICAEVRGNMDTSNAFAKALGLETQNDYFHFKGKQKWIHADLSAMAYTKRILELLLSQIRLQVPSYQPEGKTLCAQFKSVILDIGCNSESTAPCNLKTLLEESMRSMASFSREQIAQTMLSEASIHSNSELLLERNQVLFEVLQKIIQRPVTTIKTIGILYGAAHMPDIEKYLVDKLDFHRSTEDVQWLTMMRVRPPENTVQSFVFNF